MAGEMTRDFALVMSLTVLGKCWGFDIVPNQGGPGDSFADTKSRVFTNCLPPTVWDLEQGFA